MLELMLAITRFFRAKITDNRVVMEEMSVYRLDIRTPPMQKRPLPIKPTPGTTHANSNATNFSSFDIQISGEGIPVIIGMIYAPKRTKNKLCSFKKIYNSYEITLET